MNMRKEHIFTLTQVNRSAKLKQCKLEARREQWLSHHGSSLSLMRKSFFPLSFCLFLFLVYACLAIFDSVSGLQHGKESSHNGERGHVNASANTTEEKNIPLHHGDSFSLTWKNILHLK